MSVFTHNVTKRTGLYVAETARRMQALGTGEIIINAVDRDGLMQGHDRDPTAQVRDSVTLTMTALGGSRSPADFERPFAKHGVIGATPGSFFVFKGKYCAVLINYPNRADKEDLLGRTRALQ